MTSGPDTLASTRPADADEPAASARTVARIVWAILWLLPLAVLVIAAWLTPSPLGHSTHTQLGLPPCGFLVMTGLPCPGCGLTTAFAHAMHGHWIESVRANPFGFMMFAMTVAWMPVATLGAWRGSSVIETLDRLGIDRWGLLLVGASVLSWLVRVVTIIATR